MQVLLCELLKEISKENLFWKNPQPQVVLVKNFLNLSLSTRKSLCYLKSVSIMRVLCSTLPLCHCLNSRLLGKMFLSLSYCYLVIWKDDALLLKKSCKNQHIKLGKKEVAICVVLALVVYSHQSLIRLCPSFLFETRLVNMYCKRFNQRHIVVCLLSHMMLKRQSHRKEKWRSGKGEEEEEEERLELMTLPTKAVRDI